MFESYIHRMSVDKAKREFFDLGYLSKVAGKVIDPRGNNASFSPIVLARAREIKREYMEKCLEGYDLFR